MVNIARNALIPNRHEHASVLWVVEEESEAEELQVLPDEAWRSLYRDVADAVNLAVIGDAAGGASVLDYGFRQARECQTHFGWGEEFVRQYGNVLEGYCAAYGICFEPYSPSVRNGAGQSVTGLMFRSE